MLIITPIESVGLNAANYITVATVVTLTDHANAACIASVVTLANHA